LIEHNAFRRPVQLVQRFLLLSLALTLLIGPAYWGLSRNYSFQWAEAIKFLPRFSEGLVVTLQISAAGALLALMVGLVVALGRLAPWGPLRDLAGIYVHTLRNLPFIVVLLLFYFGLRRAVGLGGFTLFGYEFSEPFVWGALTLGIYESSYLAEIFRAGIQSIHKEQIESARCLGLTYLQTMSYVVLPQAFRVILPPLTGVLIAMVKESALLYIISVPELTFKANLLVAPLRRPYFFEFYTILAAYYLVIVVPLSLFSQWLEGRLGRAADRGEVPRGA
jgi:His/Glu/Gln/Arg/opine family amino acid ABC transporter permease subunit